MKRFRAHRDHEFSPWKESLLDGPRSFVHSVDCCMRLVARLKCAVLLAGLKTSWNRKYPTTP